MNLQAKRDAANKLLAEMRALNDKAIAEKSAFSSDENESFNAMERDFDALRDEIKALENEAQRNSKLEAMSGFMSEPAPESQLAPAPERKSDDEMFARMLLTNDYAEQKELRANLNITTDNQGGFVVPKTLQARVLEMLKAQNVMRQISAVMQTASTELIPVEASKANFTWMDEAAAFSETDLTFNQISIGAHKLGGMIKITDELLQDSAIDIASYITRKMVEAINDAEEVAFITGTGTKQPKGVITAATTGVTTASATAVTSDEVIDLFYSLDGGYRSNAVWLMSDSFERELRKLKVGNDYLWQPALELGRPNTILGRPVYTSTAMPAFAKNNVPCAFGDFSRYQIADRGGISVMRLNELFAGNGLVGFRVFKRVDAQLLDTNAIKTLKVKNAG